MAIKQYCGSSHSTHKPKNNLYNFSHNRLPLNGTLRFLSKAKTSLQFFLPLQLSATQQFTDLRFGFSYKLRSFLQGFRSFRTLAGITTIQHRQGLSQPPALGSRVFQWLQKNSGSTNCIDLKLCKNKH